MSPACPLLLFVVPFFVMLAPEPSPGASPQRDHDRAWHAVTAGDRPSLSTILAAIEAREGGRVLEIERDTLAGRDIYEIEILKDDGRVIELEVDAADGAVLATEVDD